MSAWSECFANVKAYELAYSRSPAGMKGLVLSLFLFTTAISYAISEAVVASLLDPYLIWPFVATAVAGTLAAVLFWFMFRHLNSDALLIKAEEPTLEDLANFEGRKVQAKDVESSFPVEKGSVGGRSEGEKSEGGGEKTSEITAATV